MNRASCRMRRCRRAACAASSTSRARRRLAPPPSTACSTAAPACATPRCSACSRPRPSWTTCPRPSCCAALRAAADAAGLPAAGGQQPLPAHAGRLRSATRRSAARRSTCAAAPTTSRASIPKRWPTRCCATAGRATASPSWRWSIRLVREAVNALAERGVPTVTLISDLSQFAPRRLRRTGQPRRRPHRRLPDRPLHRAARTGQGRDDRRQPELPRATRSARWASCTCSRSCFPRSQVVGLREGQDDADKNYRQARSAARAAPRPGRHLQHRRRVRRRRPRAEGGGPRAQGRCSSATA